MKKIFTLLSLLAVYVSGFAQIAYTISGNGLKAPSYLFGTHHLAPLKTLTDNKAAMDALENASVIVTEIDLTQDPQSMQMAMMPYMFAPADSTLSKVLSKEEFDKVDKVFTDLTGMSVIALDAFRPMVVSSNISLLLMKNELPELVPGEQLDSYICKAGTTPGKRLVPLETAAQQAQILYSSTPIRYQAQTLVEIVDDTEQGIKLSKAINEAYFKGDLEKLYTLTVEEDDDPEFTKKLLDLRNRDWLTQLPSILTKGSTFIGVGALHLAGEKGLVEGLRKIGYTVEPLNNRDDKNRE